MGTPHKIKKSPSRRLDIFGFQIWYTGKNFIYKGIWVTTKKSWWIYRIIPFNNFVKWFGNPERKRNV